MARLGESYKPTESTKPKQLHKLPPGSPIQYAHHAKGWQILFNDKGAPVLLPSLNKVYLRPGTNHIQNDMDLTEMRMRYEANGWRFLPFELAGKADKGADSYIQRVQVKGGYAYLSRWCRVVPGTSRLMPDADGWRKFLAVVAKYVDPPAAWALDDLRTKYRTSRANLARMANVIPDSDEQIERCAAVIKLLDREIKKAEARDAQDGEEVVIDGAE